MTGYTVHTGSTKKFSSSWDRIFSGSTKKSEVTSATSKSAKKASVSAKSVSVKKAASKKTGLKKTVVKKVTPKSGKRGS